MARSQCLSVPISSRCSCAGAHRADLAHVNVGAVEKWRLRWRAGLVRRRFIGEVSLSRRDDAFFPLDRARPVWTVWRDMQRRRLISRASRFTFGEVPERSKGRPRKSRLIAPPGVAVSRKRASRTGLCRRGVIFHPGPFRHVPRRLGPKVGPIWRDNCVPTFWKDLRVWKIFRRRRMSDEW